MNGVLLQAALLITVILVIRKLFGTRLHVYVRYGLWLLVVLRLLVPVNVLESPFSFLRIAEAVSAETVWQQPDLIQAAGNEPEKEADADGEVASGKDMTADGEVQPGGDMTADGEVQPGGDMTADGEVQSGGEVAIDGEVTPGKDATVVEEVQAEKEVIKDRNTKEASFIKRITRKGVLHTIWLSGSLLVGGALAFFHFSFRCKLKRMGKRREGADCPLPVYTVKNLESPCLTGVLHPVIYMPEAISKQEETFRLALTHEWVHWLHKDHLWALLRAVLVAVYWFHPFVWLAAFFSVKDGELACDYGTVRLLGEEKRFAYSEMLLKMSVSGGHRSLYSYGTLLRPGRTELKERIYMLTGKKKRKAAATASACILMLVMMGCAFTGNEKQNDAAEPTDSARTEFGTETEESMETVGQSSENKEGEGNAAEADPSEESEAGNELREAGSVQLTPKTAELSADTMLGADGPVLDYAGTYGEERKNILIFHDYFGLVVYDLEQMQIMRSLSLSEIGCGQTQGENYCQTAVSADGKTVWLHPKSEAYMYRYEVEEDLLYQEILVKTFEIDMEAKELFSNYLVHEYAIDDWGGFCSNYLYEEYEDEKGRQQGLIYLTAYTEEGDLSLRHLECVWDDMVFRLFSDETITTAYEYEPGEDSAAVPQEKPSEAEPEEGGEDGFPYTYDGVVEMVELRYQTPCVYTRISDEFGIRVHPITQEKIAHNGMDFAAEEGTDIVAAANGVVYETGYSAEWGNYVVLLHQNGEFTYYCHCKEISAKKDTKVKQGEKIGTVGSTGMSTGSHLHFALSRNGQFIDPADSMELLLPLE